MIKSLLSISLTFSLSVFSISASAVTFEVIGPCQEKAVFSGSIQVDDLKQNVGKVSVDLFNQNKIPFDGDEAGFRSILGTPTGMDSIEVLSKTKMRAHGWCYTVNNVAPDVLPGDYFFGSNEDKLVWFYGYSTYDNGEWVDYCVPSWRVHAAQFCSK